MIKEHRESFDGVSFNVQQFSCGFLWRLQDQAEPSNWGVDPMQPFVIHCADGAPNQPRAKKRKVQGSKVEGKDNVVMTKVIVLV